MRLKEKIEEKFNTFTKNHSYEPRYASVQIKFKGYEEPEDMIIKLFESYDSEWEDNQIFFYCRSLGDLLSLCNEGCEDFIITDIYDFLEEL